MYRVRRKRRARSGLFHTIRRNPVPAAMIGIGLGWLFMSDAEHSDSAFDTEYEQSYSSTARQTSGASGLKQVRHQASEMAHTAESRASEVASTVQEKAEGVVDTVQSKAEEVVDQVRGQADNIRYKTQARTRSTRGNLMHMIEDNPLTVGAVALAAGALVGLSLPITHQEEEWIGPTRDRLVDRTQEQLANAVEQVKHTTTEVGKEVQEAFQEMSTGESATQQSTGVRQSGAEGTAAQAENRLSSFDSQAQTFRQHHQNAYSSTGRPYTDYEPAYRYGYELATSYPGRERSWEDIKSEAQRQWNQRNQGAWVDMEGAIRYAWDQTRQRHQAYETGTPGIG